MPSTRCPAIITAKLQYWLYNINLLGTQNELNWKSDKILYCKIKIFVEIILSIKRNNNKRIALLSINFKGGVS